MTAPIPLIKDNTIRTGEVSYNGVLFPPAIKSSGTYEPVYDDSGRIVKYVKGTLTIECLMFPGCLDMTIATPVVPYYPVVAPGGVLTTAQNGFDVTTETTFQTIRKKLTESCGHLKFTLQGYGPIDLNDTGSTKNYDVDNGPKPKIVSWTPLSNKMAKVVWECEFAFSPCQENGVLPSTTAQFPFTVNVSIGPSGLSTRTIEGCIEISMTRINGLALNYDLKGMEAYALQYFPLFKQFKREQNFKMSNDRKTVNFSIVDTEINSDDAFGFGVESTDAEISMTGQLSPGGFRRWTMVLNGHVNLMAGYPKSFAYSEISRLFNHYYTNLAYSGNRPGRLVGSSFIEGLGLFTSQDSKQSIPILRSVKYSDKIFDRSVRFAFTWDLFVSLETLFKATGLFQPLEETGQQRENSWLQWRFAESLILDKGGFQGLGFTNNNDIIVSLCDPIRGTIYPPPQLPQNYAQPPDNYPSRGSKETTTDPNSYGATDAYHHYDSRFFRSTAQNTVFHTPLGYVPAIQENTDGALKDSPKVKIHQGSSEEQQIENKTIIHKLKPTTHTITWVGSAVRLGYPVPIPNAFSYGGKKLIKVGTDEFQPYKLGNGVDVESGKNYSIHGLNWMKQYIVSDTPVDETIVSDGHQNQYV